MNAVNYDKVMEDIISKGAGGRLLLHCCCAPCSSSCIERLKDKFKITAFFYNPNIEDGEYLKRKTELISFLKKTGWADFLDEDCPHEEFLRAVKGYEDLPEGGKRCHICYAMRLRKTYERAVADGYDYFCTTLTVSPLKDSRVINRIGEEIGGNKWLYSDFKKQNGYLRSCELSKQYGLYRQNYCGCEFSKR